MYLLNRFNWILAINAIPTNNTFFRIYKKAGWKRSSLLTTSKRHDQHLIPIIYQINDLITTLSLQIIFFRNYKSTIITSFLLRIEQGRVAFRLINITEEEREGWADVVVLASARQQPVPIKC